MTKLRRELGLLETTLCGVGIILGAGIYALVGKAAGFAGNAVWLSFLIGAAIASLTGLSYAELSGMFPKAGAEYVYVRKALGKCLAFIIGWLIIIGGFFASAAVALGFGGYFSAIFGISDVAAAIGLIILSSFIIFIGIRQSAWTASLLTLLEAGGLIAIILIGMPYFGRVNYFEIQNPFGILQSAALIFFAYIGFEEITRLAEETKRPRKNIPKALMLSILITTLLYVLVSISAVSVIDWQALAKSGSPLADVAAKAIGKEAFSILSIIALFSTANTVLLFLLSTSRIMYGMAGPSLLPDILGKVHSKTRTPWVSITVLCILSIFAALAGRIEFAANMTNFTVFVTFIFINLSVIVLRFRYNGKRYFKIPLNFKNIPLPSLFGLMISIVLLFSLGFEVLVYSFVLLFTGFFVYFLNQKTKS